MVNRPPDVLYIYIYIATVQGEMEKALVSEQAQFRDFAALTYWQQQLMAKPWLVALPKA